MAAILNVGDIAEVKFFCSDGAQQGINVLHYRCRVKAGAGISDAALAGLMSAAAATVYKAYLPTVCRYEGVRVQLINPLPVQAAQVSTAGSGAGSVITDPLPPQASLLAKKNTTLAGRRRRGRIYLPFWGESQSDSAGKPTAGALTLADNVLNVLLIETVWGTAPDTVTMTPVLYNKALNDWQEVISYTKRTAWATQRRRSLINKGDVIGP